MHPLSLLGESSRVFPQSSRQLLDPRLEASYSVAKFIAWQDYASSARSWRVIAVLVLTLVPGFVCALSPSFVPLRNPALGYKENLSAAPHMVLLILVVSFGMVLSIIGGTGIPRQMYSLTEAAVVAIVIAVIFFTITDRLMSMWRFPIPFGMLVLSFPWGLLIALVHYVFLRPKAKRFPELLPRLLRYRWALIVHLSQPMIYVALTVAFDSAKPLYQLGLIFAFPAVKFLLKRLMHKCTRSLGEHSNEVAVSTIEMCASLYQSMILQSSPSALAIGVIIGQDVLQGVAAVFLFMGRSFSTPHHELFPKATQILRQYQEQHPGAVDMKALEASLRNRVDVVAVKEALQVATAIESVLLVEYIEVGVPIVTAMFLLATFQSTSTMYNTRLYQFYDNWDAVWSSTESVLLYSALQGLSLAMMEWFVRKRYSVSAFHLLAFVLEYHAKAIQGKLLVFLPILVYFTLIHYGADFSLKFDVEALVKQVATHRP